MTLYRFAFGMLMISVVCMTIAAAYGLVFYLFESVLCVFISGYFLARGREQDVEAGRSKR